MANMTQGQVLATLAEKINWQGDDGARDGVLEAIEELWPAAPAEPEADAFDLGSDLDGGESGSSPAASTDDTPIGTAAAKATTAKV